MTTDTLVDRDTLRHAIRHEYQQVAADPDKGFHFHVGRFLADRLEYPDDQVAQLPDSAVESFAGVGNPFEFGNLQPGEHVLDLGCGAGFDAILAAQQVGPTGKVIGIDMTPAMVEKARANADSLGLTNLEIREGYLEELPVDSDSIDVVISNGVINLCPDKETVMSEIHRVLKPGGRMQISDIIVQRDVPESARQNIDLWTGWIAGALPVAAFQALIENAGFSNVRFSDKRYDTFSDAPQASSADAFGTQGVNILAMKPTDGTTTRPDREPVVTDEPVPSPVLDTLPDANDLYDAGNLGCGDGPIMEIAQRLKGMQPDDVLEIRSTDPAVASDLPAWCRMTGHTYLGQGSGTNSGRYFVQRMRE